MDYRRKRRRRVWWPQAVAGAVLGVALAVAIILALDVPGRVRRASVAGAELVPEAAADGMAGAGQAAGSGEGTEAGQAAGSGEGTEAGQAAGSGEGTEAGQAAGSGEGTGVGQAAGADGGQQGEGDSQEETMVIYDIVDGYLTVPFYPDLPRHGYDWGQIAREGGYRRYAPGGQVASRIGVDVSKYQGAVDWQQVKGSGIQFAIVRLGYRGYTNGSLRMDERYRENMEGAQAAGLDLGVYFFSQAVDVREAVEEADYVLAQIADYPLAMPVVFDTEEIKGDSSRTQGLSVKELTDITRAFCGRIQEAGYSPMVYANAKWLTTKLDLRRLTDIPVWYADYQEEPLYPYAFRMWQYTEKGQVPGIEGPTDLNIWFE